MPEYGIEGPDGGGPGILRDSKIRLARRSEVERCQGRAASSPEDIMNKISCRSSIILDAGDINKELGAITG